MEHISEKEREYDWFWLCSIPELYERDRRLLLKEFKDPRTVRAEAGKNADALAILGEKKRQAVLAHLRSFSCEEEYQKLCGKGIRFISRMHGDYPEGLLQMADAPSGLFYMGRLPRRQEVCVAVVGARMCTYNGRKNARELAERLAENGVCVVSGMAYGIDAQAQEACLAAGSASFAVLGCSADICYPRENRTLYEQLIRRGGLISEYCPGTAPMAFHFPMRNRIISGLSKMVVVVEARKKSGTLITADLALEQGKDVFAFPGRPTDELSAGCNRLIQQGAGMITDIDEFLEINGLLRQKRETEKNCRQGLATSENLVYSCLDSESKSTQSLADETGLPVWQVMRILSALQLKGLVAEIGKNHYGKIR